MKKSGHMLATFFTTPSLPNIVQQKAKKVTNMLFVTLSLAGGSSLGEGRGVFQRINLF